MQEIKHGSVWKFTDFISKKKPTVGGESMSYVSRNHPMSCRDSTYINHMFRYNSLIAILFGMAMSWGAFFKATLSWRKDSVIHCISCTDSVVFYALKLTIWWPMKMHGNLFVEVFTEKTASNRKKIKSVYFNVSNVHLDMG